MPVTFKIPSQKQAEGSDIAAMIRQSVLEHEQQRNLKAATKAESEKQIIKDAIISANDYGLH